MSKKWTCPAAVLVMVYIAILGIALPVSAGDGIPFKGYAEAAITGVVPVGDDLHLSVAATGKATHLGNYTRTETVVLHGDGSFEAEIVFTAANGDELYASAVGGFISPTTALGVATFTGGTGRFADASGGYNFMAVTPDGFHFAITFEGTIEF